MKRFLNQRLSWDRDCTVGMSIRRKKGICLSKKCIFSTQGGQNFTFSKPTVELWDPKENCATL